MKASFALTAFIGVVAAGPHHGGLRTGGKLGGDPKFLEYCSKYNKNVSSTAAFTQRQNRYHSNDNVIAEHNRKAARSSDPDVLVLGHNWTSDLEPEEYQQLLGLNQAEARRKATTLRDDRRDGRLGGRLGVDRATKVDHYADGHMVPIKDQGNCGSCWSFAALTAMEGTKSAKTGQAPVRLSEQQLVDCTLTLNPANEQRFGKDYKAYGCQGGWMTWAWDFIKDQGVMLNEDYPYFSGTRGTEGECMHDASKTVGKVKNWGQIRNSISEVKAKVAEQPLTIALDAGGAAFQFYRSGVIKESDNCGTQLNHAVVLVGYTDDGDEPSPNPDPSPDPSPGPDPSPEPEPQPEPLEDCDVTKWWHTCDPVNNRRHLQDASGHSNYWKIENSWGVGYGDGGFVRIEITGGTGVCGMNEVIEWVEWDD